MLIRSLSPVIGDLAKQIWPFTRPWSLLLRTSFSDFFADLYDISSTICFIKDGATYACQTAMWNPKDRPHDHETWIVFIAGRKALRMKKDAVACVQGFVYPEESVIKQCREKSGVEVVQEVSFLFEPTLISYCVSASTLTFRRRVMSCFPSIAPLSS